MTETFQKQQKLLTEAVELFRRIFMDLNIPNIQAVVLLEQRRLRQAPTLDALDEIFTTLKFWENLLLQHVVHRSDLEKLFEDARKRLNTYKTNRTKQPQAFE